MYENEMKSSKVCCRCVQFHFVIFQFAMQLWVMVILLSNKITLDGWKHQFGSVFFFIVLHTNEFWMWSSDSSVTRCNSQNMQSIETRCIRNKYWNQALDIQAIGTYGDKLIRRSLWLSQKCSKTATMKIHTSRLANCFQPSHAYLCKIKMRICYICSFSYAKRNAALPWFWIYYRVRNLCQFGVFSRPSNTLIAGTKQRFHRLFVAHKI